MNDGFFVSKHPTVHLKHFLSYNLKYIFSNKIRQFPIPFAELSSQVGNHGASGSRNPGGEHSPPGRPILIRSPSPDGSPPSPVRSCVLAPINQSGGVLPIPYHHPPLYVEKLIYPSNYLFLTTNARGELRFIEQNEQLLTVSYQANGDIIGILEHDGIFRGLYNLIGVRLIIKYRESYIHHMGTRERNLFPDGELIVTHMGPVGGPTGSG